MKTMGLVFSNIYDSSLAELTAHRTVASLPFGGRYRQIDFVLSNMSNSGIYNIGVITKYNYRSLMDHLGNCFEWDLNRKNGGLHFIPPFASGNAGIYGGKLEALYAAKDFIADYDYDYVVLSDTVVMCNIDYRPAVASHIKSGADITVIASPKEKNDNRLHALVVKADRTGRVKEVKAPAKQEGGALASMGMFIISRKLLLQYINETFEKGQMHLERDLILKRFKAGKLTLNAYKFSGTVLRNRDIKTYFENSMKLLDPKVSDGLFLSSSPIYTKVRDEIPSYFADGSTVENCLMADGCTVYGTAKRSILFRSTQIESGATVENSIIMQGTRVGKNARISYAILDKDVTVLDGTVLCGTPDHPVIIQKGATV